ncbi:hypothetical protein AURDEDRAFT_172302 [Auricularia subglabra TFB-10046 SS5]|nr:hypothetical protein AURDEDRAFT_172302 [Auricularia subglabra TFB-10046 SS5]
MAQYPGWSLLTGPVITVSVRLANRSLLDEHREVTRAGDVWRIVLVPSPVPEFDTFYQNLVLTESVLYKQVQAIREPVDISASKL